LKMIGEGSPKEETMPDLIEVVAWTCATNTCFEKKVTGSLGDTYMVRFARLYGRELERQGVQYGWTCTCKGFEFRGTCRHINATRKSRCGWNGVLEPTAQCEHDDEGRPCCPDCHGPVEPIKVGV
jgi:hypothetical protein